MHANIFLKLVDILNEDEYPRQICREKSVEIILFFSFCFSIYKKGGKNRSHTSNLCKNRKTNENFLFRVLFSIRETRLLIISRRKFGNENPETGERERERVKILITNFSSAWYGGSMKFLIPEII